MADVGGGSGTGSGTGAGLVGKKPPFCAVHDDGAQAAGHSLAKPESFQENALEDRRKLACVFHDDKDGDQKIADSHHRHHDIQHLDGGVFAQYDDGGESHQGDGGVKGRDVKSIFKGGGNGVSDDLADAAPADQAGEGKQYGQEGTVPALAFAGKHMMDIVSRAAPESAVEGIFLLI